MKSLGLVHPHEVEVGPRGVAGDRRFWLVDEDGRLFNNKRCGPLMAIRPEWDEESRALALTLPDGERIEGVVELGERGSSRDVRRSGSLAPRHRSVAGRHLPGCRASR